jgi:Ricin-type beta-trefoil lectin domain
MKLGTRLSALLQAGAGLLAASALAGSTVAQPFTVSISNRGTGKCLTVPNASPAPHTPIIQWICDAANVRGQRWFVQRRLPADVWLGVQNDDTSLCMTVTDFHNGDTVVQLPCDGHSVWQQWKPITLTGNSEVRPWTIRLQSNVPLVTSAGQVVTICLDLENGDIRDGVPLQVWKCDSKTNNQKWNVR